MRISEILGLKKQQPELDFVDIDTSSDMRLFLDPYFLANRFDPWSIQACETIRNYFQKLIDLIKAKDPDTKNLLLNMGEPNETCLGFSKGQPQGRGVGRIQAGEIFDSLDKSKAVATGIVEDLEDCRIFVVGIDKDKISDMTTAIIRKQLIEYTQHQARLNGILLSSGVSSGAFWDRNLGRWNAEHTEMLVIDGKRRLLVPKGIVSFVREYTPQRYYDDYVLNYLQNDLRSLNPVLIRRRKSGEIWVAKKDLKEVYPYSKQFLMDFTERHPQIFQNFKQYSRQMSRYIQNDELSSCDIPFLVRSLMQQLQQMPAGDENATNYHRLIAGIMELIFYPQLQCPKVEREINDGRKRIDITFDNNSVEGFFCDLRGIHNIYSPYILVECKNYSREIANPELDQMIGRFGDTRSRFGLIVCRQINNMELFLNRCKDTLKDGHGLIIPLVDNDFIKILDGIAAATNGLTANSNIVNQILRERCRNVKLR
jgi:hypothetical protein